ncbi:hypothetical protein PITC_051130 [Penicillium italicum]|uniref:Uncharacterized protein n=1 Tax=Penicillium italicum TaxID=40296 RepID=A0A0A2L4D6_PENIT|nr:hypothetical protein PITC_051130 [Penicillium italicum]
MTNSIAFLQNKLIPLQFLQEIWRTMIDCIWLDAKQDTFGRYIRNVVLSA